MSTVAADGDAPRQLQKPFPKENLDGQKAEKLQGLADRNNMKFHDKLKKRLGTPEKRPVHLKSAKGQDISHRKRVLARWNDLNALGKIEPQSIGNMPQRAIKTCLDVIPSISKMTRAILGLEDRKVQDGDLIPAEILRHGATLVICKV